MKSPLQEWIEYRLFMVLRHLAGRLSYERAADFGSFLGLVGFSLLRIRRGLTIENISRSFPGSHRRWVIATARGSYRNYGRSLVTMLWSHARSADELCNLVVVRDPVEVRRLFAPGRGCVLLSAHFGSWELLLSGLPLRLATPFVAVAQHQRNRKIDAVIDAGRRRFGSETVPMGPSVRQVLSALKSGRVVLMLGDQSGPRESIFIPFFGRLAATHRGAAAFCLRAGVPMVLVLLVRRADGRFDAVFEEVSQDGLTGTQEERVAELTRRHTAMLEEAIRRTPDHWLWMHRRWKHADAAPAAPPEPVSGRAGEPAA
jgi:KDO2-lipid IV(A) lauroyltransferase